MDENKVDEAIRVWLEQNGHDEFDRFNSYLEDHAAKYREDYAAFLEDNDLPIDQPSFGYFIEVIVGDEPMGSGDYIAVAIEDEAYEQAERHRDEFGW